MKVVDEEQDEKITAFSTSGDTPLDGDAQPVAPIARPVPGNVLDDLEDPGQSPE